MCLFFLTVNLKPKFQACNFKNDELHILTFNRDLNLLRDEFSKSQNCYVYLFLIINLKTKFHSSSVVAKK
jgi:hypothetical protein